MAEFEDKLNSILGNQQAMAEIMALARSLSGDGTQHGEEEEQTQHEEDYSEQSAIDSSNSSPNLSDALSQLDPGLLQMGMEVIRQVQSTEDRSAALLTALRPFLREERRGRLDRALQIARMTKLIRAVITALGERGTGEGV